MASRSTWTLAQAAALLGEHLMDRRDGDGRRARFDRRMFPRPEGRRTGPGRRAADR